MAENITPRGMPRWRETRAPQYDGMPRNVGRFSNDVQSLCIENGINEEPRWIEYAISYTRPEDYEFWDSFKNEATWDDFQKKIKELTRKTSEPIPRPTFDASRKTSVLSLSPPKLISAMILKPNHNADDPYDVNDIHNAANYTLSPGTAYMETDAAITAALPASTAAAATVDPSVLFSLPNLPSPPTHIPRPTFDASIFGADKLSQAQQLLLSMAQLMVSLAAASYLSPASLPTTNATSNAATAAQSSSFIPTPRSSSDCNFCSASSHYMRGCGIFIEYLN